MDYNLLKKDGVVLIKDYLNTQEKKATVIPLLSTGKKVAAKLKGLEISAPILKPIEESDLLHPLKGNSEPDK